MRAMRRLRRGAGRGAIRRRTAACGAAGVVGLAAVAAGCGGPSGPGAAGSGPVRGGYASALAYARCMRGHGVRDFPDPTASPGGGIAFRIDAGPGSGLARSSPVFERASEACRSLEPFATGAAAPSAGRLAAEVKWARCMRAHGVPSFPDPDAEGAFDSSRFDDRSPAFRAAARACRAIEAALGAVTAVAGHG